MSAGMEAKDDDVFDLKEVIKKPGAERQRWLSSVLKAAKDGRLNSSLTALFDILAHRKFVTDLNTQMGRRMRKEILTHATLFSGKQQKFLNSSNWPMEKVFGGNDQAEKRKTDRQKEPASDRQKEQPEHAPGDELAEEPAVPTQADISHQEQTKPSVQFPEPEVHSDSLNAPSSTLEALPSSLISRAMAKQGKSSEKADAVPAAGKKPPRKAELAAAFKMQDDSDDEPSSAKPFPIIAPGFRPEVPRTFIVPGTAGFNSVVEARRRAVSNKNPNHEGLADIKAAVLAERGLSRRSRSRSRSRGRRRSRSRSGGRSRRDASRQL